MNKRLENKVNIKDVYQMRIANIVDKFMKENEAFRERLERDKIIASITDSMINLYSLEQFFAIEDSDLKSRIGQRMLFQGLYGLLDDLTPEQIKAFEDAVEGR